MRAELPKGWAEAALDEVAHINPPGAATTVPDEQPVTFVPMAAVQELTGRIDVSTLRPFGEVKKGFTRFREGDVLFAKITPCMENGKIAVARGLAGGVGCGSTEFHVLRPSGAVLPDYLRYYLVQSAYRREAQRNMQGAVGQQRVPTDFLRESRMPVAPLAEQQRIVSRIEELFSEIDEGERALERAGRLLTHYGAAMLSTAVGGELTRQWREGTGRRSIAASTPNSGQEAPLPQGWQWIALRELICEGPTNGYSPKADPGATGTLALKLTATTSGRLRLDQDAVKRLNETIEPDSPLWLRPGDVLIQRANSLEHVGVTAIFDGPPAEYIYPDLMMRVRIADPTLRHWIVRYLNSTAARRFFQRHATGTAGSMPKISGKVVKSLPVPVPPADEMRHALDLLEARLAQASSQVADLARQRRSMHLLRQSILKAAFSGHLVPQDPRDEPAAALLARLAAGSTPAPRRRHRESATP